MKNKETGKKSDSSFIEKLKEAWSNKSTRGLFIAFGFLVAITVLKMIFKF